MTRRRRRRSCRRPASCSRRGARPHRADGHQRRRVRARAARHARQPADPLRRGPPTRSPAGFAPPARHGCGPGQSLQFYLDARPVRLDDVLADVRADVEAVAGPAPTRERPARDATALSRWRLYAAMEESLRRHADAQAAVELHAHVVIALHAAPAAARARPCSARVRAARRWSASSPRTGARRATARRTSTRCAPSSRRSGCRCRQLNGDEVFGLLWARLNPTSADGDRRAPPRARSRCSASSTPPRDREQARAAALALRARLARSSVDLKRDRHLVEIERDVEQVIYAHTHRPADQRWAGCWARCSRASRTRSACTCTRSTAAASASGSSSATGGCSPINRGAEQRGRVPDFDRYAQEREYQQLLAEMAGHERAGLFEVSIYQALRAPGPAPGPGRARRGRRLLRRGDRVGRRLQGRPRRVPPARAVGEHAAARPRRRPPRPQVRHPQRRRHRPADRHRLRLPGRDPVRVHRPRPHARAPGPLRPRARQPHAADLRAQRLGQDDDRQPAARRA